MLRGMRMYKNKKVLITGGTGFLGKAVVDVLSSKGYKKLLPIGSSLDLTCGKKTFDFFQETRPMLSFILRRPLEGLEQTRIIPAYLCIII